MIIEFQLRSWQKYQMIKAHNQWLGTMNGQTQTLTPEHIPP